jgi:3-methylfumaryl-CoA hydratase
MSTDIDHLRTWIGREQSASEVLTETLVDQFNATFDRDADEGRAPLLIHLCLAQPIAPMSALGRDGHPALGGFLPPVSLPRRMWAGGAFEFHGPVHVGEEVTRRSVIQDVQLKEGRSGALCFVTVAHEVSADGRAVLSERQDIVYRDIDRGGASPKAPDAAPQGQHVKPVDPTPTLLFRYSAMTFNGHRIHYDREFCIQDEGYPSLVVHGPMQATQLCQFAADLRGAPPKRFEFRSLSPLFDNQGYALNASETPEGMSLWTARDGGPVAMKATATW